MYLKKAKDSGTPVFIMVVLFFTVGLILGAISFFYMPEGVIDELKLSFDSDSVASMSLIYEIRNNFATEIMWIIAIWMLNNISFTAPFSVIVVALRGIIISFSVTFIFLSENSLKWILGSIIPQMVVAIPLLTVFTALGIRLSVERKENKSADSAFFILGAVFVPVTALAAASEAVLGKIFISFL